MSDNSTVPAQPYQALKDAILDLEEPLLEPLIESRLAERYGCSRTPIREALRRLESEGLISHTPRGRWEITRLSDDDLEAIFEVKLLLEPSAAALAAARATDDIRNHLVAVAHEMVKASSHQSPDTWLQLDGEFHSLIAQAVGNKYMSQAVANLNDRWWRIQLGVAVMSRRMGEASQEHLAIAEAIAAGDADQAGTLMREHLSLVGKSVHQAMEVVLAMGHRRV